MDSEQNEGILSPQSFIEALSFNHFTIDPNDPKYPTLTKYINIITKSYRLPMSADSTGLNRITQTYRCRFGGKQRGISSKTDCPCYVKYIREPDGSYSIKDSCWFHNHEIDRITFSSHFNTCTSDEINEVRNQQMIGVLPCQIRSNLDICMNSKSYYYHRQPAIKQMKTENFDEFKIKCEYPDFIRRISSSNGRFICATYVHLPVANSYYCDDVITIDDTSTTNNYNLPIEVMIVVDQEKNRSFWHFHSYLI